MSSLNVAQNFIKWCIVAHPHFSFCESWIERAKVTNERQGRREEGKRERQRDRMRERERT